MAKVTIEDISRETGLSRGTVSRALNDRPDISTKTKQRVLEACAKLNYTPSHAARSLAMGRHFAVAMLLDESFDSFAGDLLLGAAQQADRARFSLQIVLLRTGEAALPRIRALSADRVDGILVAAALDGPRAELLRQTVGDRPIVSFRPLAGVTCDVLAPDVTEAGRLAARTLMAACPGTLLHVDGADRTADCPHRAGFLEACRADGVPEESIRICEYDGSLDSLRGALDGVSGVALADNRFAIPVLMTAAATGRCPGRDLRILGYGSPHRSGHIPLATLDPVGAEVGERAAERLFQRIEGQRHDEPSTTLIAPVLVSGYTLVG